MDNAAILRRVVWLANATPASIAFLSERGIRRRVRRGEYLFREGEPCTRLFVIVRGSVAAQKITTGGATLIVRAAGPGETPGHVEMSGGWDHSAAAVALAPTELLVLSTTDVRTVMDRDPAVVRELMADIIRINRILTDRAAELAHLDLAHRLARLLVEQATEGAAPLTQGDLAAHLGASRQSVNQALHDFVRHGMLAMTTAGRVRNVDVEALTSFGWQT